MRKIIVLFSFSDVCVVPLDSRHFVTDYIYEVDVFYGGDVCVSVS